MNSLLDEKSESSFYLSITKGDSWIGQSRCLTVTRSFVIGLIQRNKLNINSINTDDLFLRFKNPKMIPTLNQDESCEQTFSKLFLINDEEDAKITLEARNPLSFENVEFRENYLALEHIELILNLNAYSISIIVSNVSVSNYYYPLPDAPVVRANAQRTKKISIRYNIEPEPKYGKEARFCSEQWLVFIDYVICVCPNLELLKIYVSNHYSQISPLSFESRMDCILKSINGVIEQLFPSFCDNVRSRIIIEFEDNFSKANDDLLEVLKIGEPNTESETNFEPADWEVSRVVKYINQKNGTEYQCRLSLYSRDDDDDFEDNEDDHPHHDDDFYGDDVFFDNDNGGRSWSI
jgi:hypothetical protein